MNAHGFKECMQGIRNNVHSETTLLNVEAYVADLRQVLRQLMNHAIDANPAPDCIRNELAKGKLQQIFKSRGGKLDGTRGAAIIVAHELLSTDA
jgi:hypothetical protein